MSDPFADAVAVLHASALGTDGEYTLASGGAPFPIRAIVSHPDEALGGARSAKASLDIEAALFVLYGRPGRGDSVTLVDGRFFGVQEAMLDETRHSYRMTCSESRP